jgi:hypothetical protein
VKRYYLLSSSTFTKKDVRSSVEGNLAPNILTVGGLFFFLEIYIVLCINHFPRLVLFGFQVPDLRSSRKDVLFFLFLFFFHHHDDVYMFFFIFSYLVSVFLNAPRLGLSFKYVSYVLFVMASGMKLINEVGFLFIYLFSLVQGNEVVLWPGGLLLRRGSRPGLVYDFCIENFPPLLLSQIFLPSCVNKIKKKEIKKTKA